MTPRPMPTRDQIADTTPLRLDVAASLAFPDGSMGASGLRREAAKGRLAVERIAGKDYTTLRAIEDMRELCRVKAKAPACGSEQSERTPLGRATRPDGLFGTAEASASLASALRTARMLKEHSPTTSPQNTSPRGASVRRLPSASQT